MDEKQIKEAMAAAFDQAMEGKLKNTVGEMAAAKTTEIVEKMRQERALFGHDITGLTEKQKKDFAEVVKAAALKMNIDAKSNEALIEEQDNRGGYLVSREVANAILRIAASVGIIMNQSQKWDLKTDELGIPNYTGAFLTGNYLGVDAAGPVQAMNFGQALLIAKKWQLAFVVGNDLLADASANLADWLLAIGGESLANMIDYQGFVSDGAPFVGLLNDADVPEFTLPTGEDEYADMNPLTDGSGIIGSLEESVLDGAAFYMHRTVWASLRAKSVNNIPLLPFGGLASPATLQTTVGQGGVKPAGEILGYPVYTCRHLPAIDANSQEGTHFMIFGNMKAMAFGDKGEMRVSQFESGAFGGKEIALADQRALVYKHRHGLVTTLKKAFVRVKTASN
jgi:HK97 family phage major capsid protein